MALLTIFLDTSVILSGLASPTGGSALLFRAADKKRIKLVTTPKVFEEATDHLSKLSLKSSHLEALMTSSIITLVPNPTEAMMEKFKPLTIDPDDVHVISGGAISGADFLLSLDKKHITTTLVQRALRPMRVLSPKQFWKWMRGTIKR